MEFKASNGVVIELPFFKEQIQTMLDEAAKDSPEYWALIEALDWYAQEFEQPEDWMEARFD